MPVPALTRWLAASAVALAGCAGLPEPLPRAAEPALPAADAPLARIAAASLPADAPGQSGFRLLFDGKPAFKFIITLDADTQLPPATARRMIGALAHPLNRPQFDGDRAVAWVVRRGRRIARVTYRW